MSDNEKSKKVPRFREIVQPKVTLHHSAYRSKPTTAEGLLFESTDLDSQANSFEFSSSNSNTNETMISSHNPALLALRNKTSQGSRNLVQTAGKTSRKNKASVLVPVHRPATSNRPLKIVALEKVRQQNELEKLTIDFKEDPVAYFSKRKDGRGHRFIYLVYGDDPLDPNFSPYELRKVPFSEVSKEYFMMSATGVTHYHEDGSTETISLDLWAQESSVFKSIRKLKVFSQYFFWKSFRIWKNFVMKQRFKSITSCIIEHPLFRKKSFFVDLVEVNSRLNVAQELLNKFLLTFISQGKYRIEYFQEQIAQKTAKLKEQYSEYLNNTQQQIKKLYHVVSDPSLVQVFDTDFPEIRRRNPNLSQLMILEKKKASTRALKTESVNEEIILIGGYILLVDYMILESLVKGCHNSWRSAKETLQQELPCVFQVEVRFDDSGRVNLNPLKEDLMAVVQKALEDSLKTLNSLPRLPKQSQMLPHLRDSGVNYIRYFNKGPQFINLVQSSNELSAIKTSILGIISSSYDEAYEYSQMFIDYFEIYKLPETWKESSYLFTYSGLPYSGTLNSSNYDTPKDYFLSHFNEMPIVFIDRVASDIERFRNDRNRVSNFRATSAKGVLYIDSHVLKEILLPIPDESMRKLQELIQSLIQFKFELVGGALKYFSRSLQQEPQNLISFVQFCEIIQKTIEYSPLIQKDIAFIDKLFEMLDQFEIQHPRNTLHQSYKQFLIDHESAKGIKSINLESFKKPLKEMVSQMEEVLSHYNEKSTSMPSTMKEISIEDRLPAAEKLLEKINSLKSGIDDIKRYQQIIGLDLNRLEMYDDVLKSANFTVQLLTSIRDWQDVARTMKSVPLVSININSLSTSIENLVQSINRLRNESKFGFSIIAELLSKVQEVYSYLEQIEMLSKGKMRSGNWISLFKACGLQPSQYHDNITIEDLSNMGILKMKEKILEITTISQGEFEIVSEFDRITTEWEKVTVPFVEMTIKNEDNLRLGDTSQLVERINDRMIVFSKMYSNPYSISIKDSLLSKMKLLDTISRIIENWSTFQNNWSILSAFFESKENRNLLPLQSSKIDSIKKKWLPIAKYALKDSRVVSIATYPQLLDVFSDMNSSLESVLSSLGKFLDTKRTSIPRFYFITNDDLLLFLSTTQFSVFSFILKKIFMDISQIDFHEQEMKPNDLLNNSLNFNKLKIYGLIGINGEELNFQRQVLCSNPIEQWIPQTIDYMHNAVRDAIYSSLGGCSGPSLIDWALLYPSYIVFLSLHVSICKEIADCIKQSEYNSKAFAQYDSLLRLRYEDVVQGLANKIKETDTKKLSVLLVIIQHYREILKEMSSSSNNADLEWRNILHFSLITTTNKLRLQFGDTSWDHGFEFYGNVPVLVHTKHIESLLQSSLNALSQHHLPLLTGTVSTGKKLFFKYLSALFGKFLYTCLPVQFESEVLLIRSIIGAATSGSWVVFNDIDQICHRSLSVLFDSIRSLISAQNASNPRFVIMSKFFDVQNGCSLFLSSNQTIFNNSSFPSQIISFARPISLVEPDMSKIIETQLVIYCFKESRVLASSLIILVKSGLHLFASEVSNSLILNSIERILKQSVQIRKLGVMSEELILAYSAFNHFRSMCHHRFLPQLLNMVFSAFPIGNSYSEFIIQLKGIDTQRSEPEILEFISKEIKVLGNDLPIEYLSNQILKLIYMLERYQVIILSGPPNSGKTLIFSILNSLFNRLEFITRFPWFKPFNIETLYHNSDFPKRYFGFSYDDPSNGFTTVYGIAHSAVYSLCSHHHNKTIPILRFIGNISNDLSGFVLGLIQNKGQHPVFPQFVIECNSIDKIPPSLISISGIIPCTSFQSSSFISQHIQSTDLIHPSIPFAQAVILASDQIDRTQIHSLRSVFCEISPLIVRKVFALANHIGASQVSSRLEGLLFLASEIIPKYVAIIAINSCVDSNLNPSNENDIRSILVLAYYHLFSSLLHHDSLMVFDKWLRVTFSISIPSSWIGFDLPKPFLQYYTEPSLRSLWFNDGNFVPINSSPLKKMYTIAPGTDEQLSLALDKIDIYNPQIIPDLHIASIYLKTNTHILIHGPQYCGKSSFLRQLLSITPNVIPLYIYCSPYLTTESILSLIENQTGLLSKTVSPDISNMKYVLIFENVEPQDSIVIEFIRMIIQIRQVFHYSPSDRKVFERIDLKQFSVVSTTRNISQLPYCFVSQFALLQINTINDFSCQYISNTIMSKYGIEENRHTFVTSFCVQSSSMFPGESLITSIMNCVKLFCYLPNPPSLNETVLLLLFSLFSSSCHKYPHEKVQRAIKDLLKSEINDQQALESAQSFFSGIIIVSPQSSLTNEFSCFQNSFSSMESSQIYSELTYLIELFNSNSHDKLHFLFSKRLLMHWSYAHHALSMPGRNLIFVGQSGSGKFSLARILSHMCECDFVNFSPPSQDDLASPEERRDTMSSIIRDCITNACVNHRKSVFFIRATNDNHDEVRVLSSLASDCCIIPYFNKSNLDELLNRVSGLNEFSLEQRLIIMNKISQNIRIFIRVIIAVDEDLLYDIKSPSFDYFHVSHESDDSYHDLIRSILNSERNHPSIKEKSLALCKLIEKLVGFMKNKHQRFHSNMVIDFVSLFNKLSSSKMGDIEIRNQNIESAVKFISDLQKESITINQKSQQLLPSMQKLKSDTESLESSYLTRKEAIESRRIRLKEDKEDKEKAVHTYEDALRKIDYEMKLLEPQVMKVSKIVDQLTENDVETIRITTDDPHKSVSLLLEVLCIFLGLPKPYERSGKLLLKDPQFINIIKARINISQISHQVLTEVLPYVGSNDLNAAELEANCPPLRTIYDWIETLCSEAVLMEQFTDTKKKLEDNSSQLRSFIEEMNLEITSIEQVEITLSNEKIILDKSNSEKAKVEKEYNEIINRKTNIDVILQNIDQFLEKWNNDRSLYSQTQQQYIGDAITIAFYIVFCGYMVPEERINSMNSVKTFLENEHFSFSYSNPLDYINDSFIFESSEEVLKSDVPFSISAIVDTYHVLSSQRTPLLIDPDGIVLSMIISTFQTKRTMIISQSCASLDSYLAIALSEGKVLILLDVDCLHPSVCHIMPLSLIEQEMLGQRETKIGSKIITIDPKFRLIMVSSLLSLNSIPESLLDRVTLIDVSSTSLDTVQSFFVNTFVDFFSPDLTPRIAQMQKTEISQRSRLQKIERQVLDIFSDIAVTKFSTPDYDCLADTESIKDLVNAKQQYFVNLGSSVDFGSLRNEFRDSIKPFMQHVNLCHTFWKTMSRELSTVCPSAKFSLFSYQKQVSSVFVNDGLHSGTISADQHTLLRTSLISSTFQYVFSSIPVRDSLFFLFISAFLLKEKEKKLSREDLGFLIEHFYSERIENCDFITCDINDKGSFEHLKYTNIINIYSFIYQFIEEQFGSDFSNLIPHFQVDSLITNTSSIPTIISCGNYVDPTSMIHTFILSRFKHENIDEISLSDNPDNIKIAKKSILTALNRGNWVILHYSSPNRAAAGMIADIFTQISTTSVNTNFRFILICTTLDYICPSMIAKSRRIAIDDSFPLRNTVFQLFNHHSSQIVSTTNPRAIKRITFLISIVIGITHFINNLRPIGFNSTNHPSELLFRDIIKQIRFIIDTHPSDIPFHHISQQIMNIVYSGVSDYNDRKRLKSILSDVCVPAILDDSFSLSQKDSEKWVLPSDIPLSGFSQIIQKLPLFPPSSILRMNSKQSSLLLNWNLSQWIITPFLSFHKTKKSIDHKAALSKIENFLMLMPDSIPVLNEGKMHSLVFYYLLTEIDKYNKSLASIHVFLSKAKADLSRGVLSSEVRDLFRGHVPYSWKKSTNIWFITHSNKFISYLIEKHSQLLTWIQGSMPQIVDAYLIDDIKGLLYAFLCDSATKMEQSIGNLSYEFSFAGPKTPNCITLSRLSLAFGSLSGNEIDIIQIPNKSPFTQVPELICKIVEHIPRTKKYFNCPLYYNAIASPFFEGYTCTIRNGNTDNLAWTISLPTKRSEEELINAGVALYCRVPPQFC